MAKKPFSQAEKGLNAFDKVKQNIYKMRDIIKSINASARIVLARVEGKQVTK